MRAMRPGLECSAIDAVAEIDRLLEVVRDEQHGRVPLGGDAQHLVLQRLARHGVERAERLVHQQHGRVLRQAARDLQPLLHAARELRGILLGVVGEADLGEQRRDARLPRSAAGTPHRLQRQADIAGDRAPGQQRAAVVLEHDGDVARRPR